MCRPKISPAGGSGNIVITYIFFDGVVPQKESDEYVEITNQGTNAVQLGGWFLHDDANNPHSYRFPSYVIQPGEKCRVYTDEYHPETCGFNFSFGKSAIWNNSGDCAYLKDASGIVVDTRCY